MLRPKQRCFVDEYLIDLNATQSAIRAGYSPRTANEQSARLLANVSISHEIELALNKRSKKTQIDAEYVITALNEVAERCLQRKPVMEFDRTEKCMVQAEDEAGHGIWTFDSSGANRSLELLGKHLNIFNESQTFLLQIQAIPALVAQITDAINTAIDEGFTGDALKANIAEKLANLGGIGK